MSFEAKYYGECASEDCQYRDNRIRPGDEVEYQNDELVHTKCAATERLSTTAPLCAACFTYHRGECL